MLVIIDVRHKSMNMAKKLILFRPPFGLNNDDGGDFKGGCPSVNGGSKRAVPLAAYANCGFSDPAHTLWWVPEAFPWL